MPRSRFRIHKLFVAFARSTLSSHGLLSTVILERSEGPALVHYLLQIREREIRQAGPSLRSRMTMGAGDHTNTENLPQCFKRDIGQGRL
jgi:hypothetical protein